MKSRTSATDLALVAVFAALIAALSLVPAIPVPGIPVPITLQTLAVALTGLVLGGVRGFLATLLYLVVGLLGLPVFAGFTGGVAVLGKASAGYLLAFPLAALVAGLLAGVVLRRASGTGARVGLLITAALAASALVVHPLGIAGLVRNAHLTWGRAFTVDLTFWIGDVIKSCFAGAIAATVHRAFPALLAWRRPAAATA